MSPVVLLLGANPESATLATLTIVGGIIVALSAIAALVAFFGFQKKTSTMTLLKENNEAQEKRISILEGQAVECDHANSILKKEGESLRAEVVSLTRLVTKEDSVEKLGVTLTETLNRQHSATMKAIREMKPRV